MARRIVAAIYVDLFTKRFRKAPVDLLIVWGGFQLPVAAALAAAQQAGIRTLFCENGYLPKTIVMDTKGINAATADGTNWQNSINVTIDDAARRPC